MRKKGLIGIISIFIILFLLTIGGLYWFFVFKDNGEETTTKISIVPESVFVNDELKYVVFNFSINEHSRFINNFTVILEDEKLKKYSENFTELFHESLVQKIVVDYSNSGLNKIERIFVVPILINEEAGNIEKFNASYDLTEIDLESVNCNNDGIIDIGEECDDGNQINSDGCLNSCNLAYCGDGFVQKRGDKIEECDDGSRNSDTFPDSCRTDCALPKCGDNVIDSGEECDLNNFGEFSDGIGMCGNYSLKYGSGNLSCADCKIKINACKEIIRALKLDGIDGSISIPLDFKEDKTYTFSVWVKSEKESQTNLIIGCTSQHVSLKTVNRNYIFKVITDDDSAEKEVIATGAGTNMWDHVVAVHSSSHAKIYLNGYIKDSKAQAGEIKDDAQCRVGSDETGSEFHFKGMLDNFMVYDKVLSDKEILEIYSEGQNSDSLIHGPALKWEFDEGSGIIATDSSGNNYNGKIEGNPEWILEEVG